MIHKALKVGLVVAAVLQVLAATIIGAVYVSQADSRRAEAEHKCEDGKRTTHKVVIQNDKVVPAHTKAKRCDTLTINNLDDKERYLAFGVHNKHISYDGVSERYLTDRHPLTITLRETGDFRFHDHIQEAVQGTFAVRPEK